MVTDTLTPPAEDRGDKPCRCGCAPCEDTCCRLECLVQPRFFCGQLLTDQDLKALLDWTAGKLRLARYRHGWGVVCGLEVRCDPKRPSGIIIGPGYAIDCCGHDIIVCEDYRFDVSPWCPPQRCEPGYAGDSRQGRARSANAEAAAAGEAAFAIPYAFSSTTPFDVFIDYVERGAEPKTTLGRCGCGDTAPCEDSRTREAFQLRVAEPKAGGEEEHDKAAEEYRTELGRLRDFVDSLRATEDREAVRRRLVSWIRRHPLHQFCFVSHVIERLTAEELADVPTLVSILFWIVQDHRNAHLACRCYACESAAGVPLARVWLDPGDRALGQGCQIVGVEWRPPYRRSLAPVDCWPSPRQCVSLAGWVWRDPQEAAAGLTAAGVEFQTETLAGAEWASIDRVLACDELWVCEGERIVVLTVNAGEPLGPRVVGFCRAGTAAGAAEGAPAAAAPGERERPTRRQSRGSRS